jgi:hypothetical protein
VEPVAPFAEPLVPAVAEPVAVELPAPESAVPLAEPVAPVAEPVAPVAEPVAPVAEPVPAAPVLPVSPVAAQPSTNGDGLWLGKAQEVTPQPAVAPQPVEPAPEPIQNVQVIEPTVLQAESLEAPAVPAVAPEPEPEAVAAAEPVATPTPSWAVELRLVNGERIEVGVHASNEEALDAARAVVAHASIEGSWPFVDGRFLRPEAILSVDLVELADDRWLGSSARAAWGDQS